jgi:hypothetical protein
MLDHVDNLAKSVTTVTYSVSGGLVISDWLSVLDDHAAAFGVALGILTYVTNLVFQFLNHRIIKANNGERRKG